MAADLENIKKLMCDFDKFNEEWHQKKNEVDEAYRKMSDTVKAIAQQIAPEKEIRVKGQKLTIVCKTSRKTGIESWFFRGLAKDDSGVIEIE